MRQHVKLTAFILCLVILATFSGCAKNEVVEETTQTYTASPVETSDSSDAEATVQATDVPEQTPTATPEKEYSEEEIIEAIAELVKTQENGFNIRR